MLETMAASDVTGYDSSNSGVTPQRRCYTGHMPTMLPRYTITETSEVRGWLDDAERMWPETSTRADLVRRLIKEGHKAISEKQETMAEQRRRAIKEASGSLTGVFPPDAHQRFLEEWPE